MLQIFTDAAFKTQVLENALPVVVDFWAPWCGPCRMMQPALESLSQKMKEQVVIGKLNVEENTITATQYSIMSLPTFVLFSQGKEVARIMGSRSEEDLEEWIKDQVGI